MGPAADVPAVVAGLGLGGLAFAFATRLWLALAVRFVLLGMCNGWPVLLGPLCFEIGGTRQAFVMGLSFSAGGLMNLLGPAVGGFTYKIWGDAYPALVPSLVGTLIAALTALAAYAWLPETRPPRAETHSAAGKTATRTSEAGSGACAGAPSPDSPMPPAAVPEPLPAAAAMVSAETGNETAEAPAAAAGWCACARARESIWCSVIGTLALLRMGNGMMGWGLLDVLPLWAIATVRAGGLAASEHELGLYLFAAGAINLVYTSLLMSKIVTRLGVRASHVASNVGLALVMLAIPLAQTAPRWLVVLLFSLNSCGMLTDVTALMVGSNEASPPELRASINAVMST